jgi:hypothetical protein
MCNAHASARFLVSAGTPVWKKNSIRYVLCHYRYEEDLAGRVDRHSRQKDIHIHTPIYILLSWEKKEM